MTSHKDRKMKQFIISTRKKITTGLTNAPVFAMQKKRKRIYNQKGKRHWRSIDLGKMFTKANRPSVQGKGFKKTKRNHGKANRNQHRMHKKMDKQ